MILFDDVYEDDRIEAVMPAEEEETQAAIRGGITVFNEIIKHIPKSFRLPLLEKLARSSNGILQIAIALHKDTPHSILNILLQHKDSVTACAVAVNDKAPVEAVKKVLGKEGIRDIVTDSGIPLKLRLKLAKRYGVPVDVIEDEEIEDEEIEDEEIEDEDEDL